MSKREYKPRKGSLPYLTLEYLKKHGESKNEDIRHTIGINMICVSDNYADRSKYYFDVIIDRLMNEMLVRRTKIGYYKLIENETKEPQ
jgi:hypothetical protein